MADAHTHPMDESAARSAPVTTGPARENLGSAQGMHNTTRAAAGAVLVALLVAVALVLVFAYAF